MSGNIELDSLFLWLINPVEYHRQIALLLRKSKIYHHQDGEFYSQKFT